MKPVHLVVAALAGAALYAYSQGFHTDANGMRWKIESRLTGGQEWYQGTLVRSPAGVGPSKTYLQIFTAGTREDLIRSIDKQAAAQKLV
jgi:hypothetical protein